MSELLTASAAPAWSTIHAALPRYTVRLALLIGAYYGTARFGLQLSFSGPVAAIVWLPVGVGVAFLALYGLQLWPGVLIGDLLVNNYTGLPWTSTIGQACGNLLEVLVAAFLIRRLLRRGSPLDTVAGLGRMAVAIAAATALSATIGFLSLRVGEVVAWGAFTDVWRTWWLGDTAGALVVVPLALAWSSHAERLEWTQRRAVEAALLVASVVGLSEVGFHSTRPIAYLVFPALMWAALRFGQRGAATTIAGAVGLAIWSTVHYVGPFHVHSVSRSILSTQLFILVAALSTLCLTAVVAERETFAAGLARSRVRLVEAADNERRRLERNLHDGAQHRLTSALALLGAAAEQNGLSREPSATVLAEAEAELSLAIDELRELARGIHPAVLTDLGLANGIRSIAAHAVIPVELGDLPPQRLDPIAEATAYYVVAEAVTNAQRYAGASSIRASATLWRGRLVVEVVDDGVGGADIAAGSGLQGIADRVEAVGGTFRVDSVVGRGTRVVASIPARVA